MAATVREVAVPEHLRELAARAVMLTSPEAEDCPAHVKKYVRLGASIRGGQALIAGAQVNALLEGQANITADGLRAYLRPALRHRLVLNFEAGADEITADDILRQVDDILKQD
ncbi:AAA family ATPase [Planctomycetota bacterium]